MKNPNLPKRLRGLLMALVACGLSHTAHALLIVTSTVSPVGGNFHHEFSIENSGSIDFSIVSLAAPIGDPLIAASLIVPLGFLGLYDDALGFVDFIEGTAPFAAGTTATGFSFDSAAGQGAGFFDVFTAIDVEGVVVTGNVVTAGIPEPMTLSLVVLGGLMAGVFSRKKKPSQGVAVT